MTPFDEMNRMFREMDRAFDQFRTTWMHEFATPGFGTTLETGHSALESGRDTPETDRGTTESDGTALAAGRPGLGTQWPAFGGLGAWTDTGMADGMALEQEGDAYVFVMDLPGFEKSDIDLGYENGGLTIDAHTDVEAGTDTARSVRSRRVSRRVPVPAEIVADEIAATYHNGVLEVRLPIVEDDRDDGGHRIEIE